MSDDQLDDLKQFIAATVSQVTASMATKDDIQQVRNDLKRFEQKVDDGFAGIGDVVEDTHERQSQFDQRLTKLEQQVA